MAGTRAPADAVNTAPAAGVDPDACSPLFLDCIPRDFARDHALLSQGMVDGHERLAVAPQTDPLAVHNVGVRLRRPVVAAPADAETLHRAIDQSYERHRRDREAAGPVAADAVSVEPEDGADLDQLLARAERDLLSTTGKAPVVKLVDRLLFRAVQLGASDLHVQPLADHVVIRHRLDGVLDDGIIVPAHLQRPLVSRIKVMGRMDVAERLVPQDGRATVTIGDRAVDLRISSLPTAHGERIVIRLLDSENQLCEFARLGMPAGIATPFLAAARRSNGIILVTGPTGSGKTTTLYATLRELDTRERNIMTIEDPIEYELHSLGLPISQSQVNDKKGVNFATGLRHILRQDPDIIMVGEIRDTETARIAIQSALTGHLVFSTLHTNDAVSAVTRLIDLGLEPYLVSASLSVVMAQRLVRTICPDCHGRSLETGAACDTCNGTGHRGRTGVFELLALDEQLRGLVARGADEDELRLAARRAGMQTLAQAGAELIAAGSVTRTEVERVVHG